MDITILVLIFLLESDLIIKITAERRLFLTLFINNKDDTDKVAAASPQGVA